MSFQLARPVCAAVFEGACIGDKPASTDVVTIRGIICLVSNLIVMLPKALTLIAVFMVIIAGIRIINAGAEPKALAAAWAQLTYAIVGLVLVSAIWLILVLIEKFTGAPVTIFQIP